jgi:electron transfer flavoprotein alpha subunit
MVMKMPEKDSARKGEIHRHDWVPPEGELPVIVDFIRDVQEIGSVDIVLLRLWWWREEAPGDPATFPLLEELAELVGGTIACSRPVWKRAYAL